MQVFIYDLTAFCRIKSVGGLRIHSHGCT